MTDTPASPGSVFDRLEKLLEFPCDFPLKIMGRRVDGFAQAISDLVREHAPDFDPGTMVLKPSSQGTWLSLTVVVRIESRAQLEALYRAVAGHPMVRVVL
jgi:putative lipoic acid-binding regulatory protein